jgi:hypothetical protein
MTGAAEDWIDAIDCIWGLDGIVSDTSSSRCLYMAQKKAQWQQCT